MTSVVPEQNSQNDEQEEETLVVCDSQVYEEDSRKAYGPSVTQDEEVQYLSTRPKDDSDNTDPTTCTAYFESKDMGISLDIPYNPNWGNATYKIPPIEVLNEVGELRFGPLAYVEGGLTRLYQLQRYEKRTVEAIIIEADQEQQKHADECTLDYSVQTHGNLETVEREVDCVFNIFTIEVPGSKYNYVFTAIGSVEPLVKVVESVNFVE